MFHSLRWRIILSFGFIILLAVFISGALAVWTMRNQFDTLVTEDGLSQAADIAVLLETQYNLHGNLDNVSNLLFEFGYLFPAELDGDYYTESMVIINEAGDEIVYEVSELGEYFDIWDEIIAVELGLSMADYDDARYEESILDLAEAQGIAPDTLVSAIMRVEQTWLNQGSDLTAEDKLFILTDVLYQAQGDDATRLPITSNDELGEMSQAFNTLTEALDTQQHLRRRLIADISHELNTPLSVIQLEMKALQDGLQSPAEASAQVTREINLLHSLANDLALLADTDQGELTLDLEPVAMGVFMETAVSRWQAKAEVAGITLQLKTAPNLPTVSLDAVRLSQALGNLIDNGLQHTPSGGQIMVSCHVGSLPEQMGEWVITAVQDNGRGIAPEDLPFVFERFYRADRSRQRGGRGLGLAIVEQIITLHGGIVWAESQPGEGSIFSYAIPV